MKRQAAAVVNVAAIATQGISAGERAKVIGVVRIVITTASTQVYVAGLYLACSIFSLSLQHQIFQTLYLDSIQCSHGLSPGSDVNIAIPVMNLLKFPAHNSSITTPAPNNVT